MGCEVPAASDLVVAEGRRVVLAAKDTEEDLNVGLRIPMVDGHRQIGAHQAVVALEPRSAIRVWWRAPVSTYRPEVDWAGRRGLLNEVAILLFLALTVYSIVFQKKQP